MKRRQFIGATAVVCVGAFLPDVARGKTLVMPVDLNWSSDVVKTIARNRAGRMPVVTGVSMKNDGSEIAVVGDDHHVGIYDMATQTLINEIDAHRDWVRSAVYAPKGSQLATAGNDRALRVWGKDNYRSPVYTRNHDAAIIQAAYSPDATKLATVGFEKSLRVYDAKTGRLDQRMICPCPDNHAVAFSSNAEMVAAAGRCGTVRIWSVASGKVVAEVKAHRQRVRSLQFTADDRLVSVSDDRMVKIIDPKSGAVENTLPRQTSKLFSAQLLPGDLLAIGGSDNQIRVWNLGGGQEVGILRGHTGTVSSLAFGHGVLVSGSFDTQVRIWKVGAVGAGQPFERRANQQWKAMK